MIPYLYKHVARNICMKSKQQWGILVLPEVPYRGWEGVWVLNPRVFWELKLWIELVFRKWSLSFTWFLMPSRIAPPLRLGSNYCLEIPNVNERSTLLMLTVWVIETIAFSWLIWHVEEQENMSREFPDLLTSLLKTRLALFEMVCGCVSEMWLVFLEESNEA